MKNFKNKLLYIFQFVLFSINYIKPNNFDEARFYKENISGEAIIFDVGANLGTYTSFVARTLKNINLNIYAFEPNKQLTSGYSKIKILNENNYSTEDCILIIRTLISKSKRLSKILKDYEKNKDLEQVISTQKPPIFWKDKDAVKTQVKAWSSIKINDLVFKINDLELLIKKNSSRSLNILYDFLIETAKAKI